MPEFIDIFNKKQWSFIQRCSGLTPRERQIAELSLQGLKGKEIAKILRIRPGTVKTHMRNIYRKTKAKSKIKLLLTFATILGGVKRKN